MTGRAPRVDIVEAAGSDEAALDRLFQLYIHDFSGLWAGLPHGELEDDGRFLKPFPLANYRTDPERAALLIRVDGRLAGFALVDATGKTGLPLDRNMKDFFVVRKHRRAGVGLAAARGVFARFPGRWELAVFGPNVGALAFWRATVATLSVSVDELGAASPGWEGCVLRFEVPRRG